MLTDWSEVSRRWSVLKDLSANLLAGYAWSMVGQNLTQFWPWYPVGTFSRPFYAFEKLRGDRSAKSATMGQLVRTNLYQLVVLWPETLTDGTLARADEKLDILNEELITFLEGRRIPFYNCHNPESLRRKEHLDFSMHYVSDERASEKNDQNRNLLVMRWQIEV